MLASNYFGNRTWSVIFVLLCAGLFATRFISVTYTLIAAALTIGLVGTRRKTMWTSEAPRLLVGLGALFLSLLLALPFLLSNLNALYEYYFVGHMQSAQGAIRAAEQGVFGRTAALLFYPHSLVADHLGNAFLWTVALLFGVFFIAAVLDRRAGRKPPAAPADLRPTSLDIAVSLIWVLIPLGLFTFDQAKSPVVASTMVVPIVISVLLFLQLFRRSSWQIRQPLAALVLLLGVVFSISAHLRYRPAYDEAKALKDLYSAVDQIALDARGQAGKTIKIATDSLAPYFSGTAVRIMMYERGGPLVPTQELLATSILAVQKEHAFAAIDAADYALITLSNPPSESSAWPFNKVMYSYRNDLRKRAASQMTPIRLIQVLDHTFEIFARPSFMMVGRSGEWLSSDGARLRFSGSVLRERTHLVMSGHTHHSDQLKDGLRCNAFLLPSRITVPSQAYIADDSYFIALDLSNLGAEEVKTVEIELQFPTYFVPAERGINPDTRKLAVLLPSSYRLVASKSEYPPQLLVPTSAKR